VYKEMAASIFGISVDEVSGDQRFLGKTAILGAGFGMGWERFMDQCRTLGRVIDEDLARLVIQIYRDKNSAITGLWKQGSRALEGMLTKREVDFGRNGIVRILPQNNAILLPSGLSIRYNSLFSEQTDRGTQYLYKTRKGLVRIYGGKLVENVVQALANCILKEQMLRIKEQHRPLLTVHDSVVFCVPDEKVHTACTFIQECMRWVPDWAEHLPVNCELKTGKNYGDTKKWTSTS
jgi:DNA polymerase